MRHVIIGGSIAGISAAKSIRETDAKADITMMTDEKGRAYYRPLISFLIEREDADVMFEEDPVGKYSLRLIQERAEGIDGQKKEVIASSGNRVSFDRLLIATGSSPSVPPVEGLQGKGVFTLRTLADALAIRKYAAGKKNAVVLGGGLVGLKAAIPLMNLGLKVTLVEKAGQLLPERLDRRGSQIIGNLLRNAGFEIITGESAAGVLRKKGNPEAVQLISGKTLPADIIVIATGVKPNIGFLKNSGVAVQSGIVVDEHLLTGVADVYAAGDVVEYPDVSSGKPRVSGLWLLAEEMGKLAGKNMAGGNFSYRGFLPVMNATSILGVPFISLGTIAPPPDADFETFVDDSVGYYRKFVFRDNLLVGTVLLGEINNAGIFTNLIRNRVPVDKLKKEILEGDLDFVDVFSNMPTHTLNA